MLAIVKSENILAKRRLELKQMEEVERSQSNKKILTGGGEAGGNGLTSIGKLMAKEEVRDEEKERKEKKKKEKKKKRKRKKKSGDKDREKSKDPKVKDQKD